MIVTDSLKSFFHFKNVCLMRRKLFLDDKNRVILLTADENESDYINASYITVRISLFLFSQRCPLKIV